MRVLLAAGFLCALAAAAAAGESAAAVPFGGRLLCGIAVSPDGGMIAMGGDEKKGKALVVLWDLRAAKEIARYRPAAASIEQVAFLPDSKRLLVVPGGSKSVAVYNIETGQVNYLSAGAGGGEVLCAFFSSDGAFLTAVCKDKNALVFDMPGARLARTVPMPNSILTAAASPAEPVFATTGGDANISIWDMKTATLKKQIALPEPGVFSVAYSPDGKLLAAGGLDGKVRVWDAAAGGLLRELTHQADHAIGCVRFSPDGSLVAARGAKLPKNAFVALGALAAGAPVRFWDAKSGKVLGDQPDSFHPPVPNSSTVAFTPDGNTLASIGSDGVNLWDVRKIVAQPPAGQR
jgi:WD40 repeat protein